MEIWSDDPEEMAFRVYTENVDERKLLSEMGLKVVARYRLKGRLVGEDFRATKEQVEKIRGAMRPQENKHEHDGSSNRIQP